MNEIFFQVLQPQISFFTVCPKGVIYKAEVRVILFIAVTCLAYEGNIKLQIANV